MTFSKLKFQVNKLVLRGLSAVALLGAVFAPLLASTSDFSMSQSPMYLGDSEPPLMMLVMSRDEQLFNRAYSDYTNLQQGEDGDDGKIDTTYTDSFDYSGYFDPNLCYGITNSVFKAAAAASGTNLHQCAGNWSGNFLNWVTMSRLDLLRFVLYGGKRSTDTVGSSGAYQTILERAYIPSDLHAWVKVYSGSDIGKYTPYSTTTSFCNTSLSPTGAPLMRVASGSYTEWASVDYTQCNTGVTNAPSSSQVSDLTVRVDVCGNTSESLRESFCRSYNDGTNTYYRPAGLLQQYGESGKLRFGLVSGTYDQPRAGGVLRRNIGRFAGNSTTTCSTGDEVNTADGRFCYLVSGSTAEGIVSTVDRFTLTYGTSASPTGWKGNNWTDCSTYSILNRQDSAGYGYLKDPNSGGSYACSAWGNPIAEMYAEALKYIAGGSKTSAFNTSTTSDAARNLPGNITWRDPYGSSTGTSTGLGYSYCSSCSILVMSSGVPSFDSDDIPTVTPKGGSTSISADTATKTVGDNEGITGGSYFAGRITNTLSKSSTAATYADYCASQTVDSLGKVLGICPDSASTEGSYRVAGLAAAAATTDLRPDLVSTQGKSAKYKNVVKTYAVQMAESLPSFQIPVGGKTITLSPLCQSNNDGGATAGSSGWRTCSIGNVAVGKTASTVYPYYSYGRNLQYDSNGNLVSGSYKMIWEDSLWGNDHDNDGVTMLSFCVGTACSVSGSGDYSSGNNICWRATSSASQTACNSFGGTSNEVMVRVEVLSAYAGNALLFGFNATGTNSDGTKRDLLRVGNNNGSTLNTTSGQPTGWGAPVVYRFTAGTSSTGQLENPLWYAAKYGNFTDKNGNGKPDSGEWDSNKSGTPDGYFLARNPAALKSRLQQIFDSAANDAVAVGGSASSSSINSNTFGVYSSFSAGSNNDWTGDVVATSLSTGLQLWSAATKLNAMGYAKRNIFTVATPTQINTSGEVTQAVDAGDLERGSVDGSNRKTRMASLGLNINDQDTIDWLGSTVVNTLLDYLKGAPNTAFRTRSSLLGDIVNSSPVVSLPTDDYGYSSTWSSGTYATYGTSYKTFMTSKSTRIPAVYVGANDGMLHGFNATTGTNGGNELFGFVPYSAFQHLGELANPVVSTTKSTSGFQHRYYVDGPVVVGDAYYSSAWHTVAIGSTGAGGASETNAGTLPQGSVFALDVTDPSTVTSSSVLWELSAQNDANLGQVLGSATVVPVKTATGVRFVAIFGNGANSVNGNPVLYVVDVGTGQVLSRLSPTGAAYQGKNGIVNVAVAALNNSQGLADTVYAGDLRGNLWKFDISSATASSWSVAFSGKPLFQAINSDNKEQAITGHLLLKTAVSGAGGVMVYFGTGRYFVTGDASDSTVQSLYAVQDNLSSVISGRSALVSQTIGGSTSTSGSEYESESVSSTTVNYATSRGWYLDLKLDGNAQGERFIGTPYLLSGVVYFATYVPTVGTDCGGGGENWLYGLGALNGAGALSGLTDSTGKAVCQGACGRVSTSTNSTLAGSTAPMLSLGWLRNEANTTETGQCTVAGVANGIATGLYNSVPCGRQSWRQLK
ncbi:type IV pilus assembly protein PilY1 [Pseudoxanthomonas sp. GM95]|uniref:pilus assembly protein n=1 Tax=Pseudoxanthomonas sp. GM95 TaxID=1881043 RepID=UPI0008CFF1E8|nr:PilC/PilY family type IV pilus protein [Pseudoxanthomonas sp. GM95]SEL74077.1 type IV pilus assembly protein PilY1 [Pseudoxanthomonas sp. GM95]